MLTHNEGSSHTRKVSFLYSDSKVSSCFVEPKYFCTLSPYWTLLSYCVLMRILHIIFRVFGRLLKFLIPWYVLRKCIGLCKITYQLIFLCSHINRAIFNRFLWNCYIAISSDQQFLFITAIINGCTRYNCANVTSELFNIM